MFPPAPPSPAPAPGQPGQPQAGAAPQGPPQPHPAEARVQALETQLASQAQQVRLAGEFNARLLAIREADPEGYRYLIARLRGQPGVDPAPPQPAAPEAPQAEAEDPLGQPGQAPPSALPREVQQALGQIPQLIGMVQGLQAELAGLKTRNLESDVERQLGQVEQLIGDPEIAKAVKAAVRQQLEENPGLARVPGVIETLAMKVDYKSAQERAVKKAIAEEQARQQKVLSLRGLGGMRGLSADAGAQVPLTKTPLEAIERAMAEVLNGAPESVAPRGR